MIAEVIVAFKPIFPDAVGMGKLAELRDLGFHEAEQVRSGKLFYVSFAGVSRRKAKRLTEAMCRDLLASSVIEEYCFSVHTEKAMRSIEKRRKR